MLTVYTIGHSTHDKKKFLEMLKAHGIKLLIDVRTIPKSRKVPQFNSDVLEEYLRKHKILYVHMPQLGGLRHSRKDSANMGWRNLSFRGFADYMQIEEFWKGISDLILFSKNEKTAIMCAEALPWRCHRSLIADALLSRGVKVFHILSEKSLLEHRMTEFAKVRNGRITYPERKDINGGVREIRTPVYWFLLYGMSQKPIIISSETVVSSTLQQYFASLTFF